MFCAAEIGKSLKICNLSFQNRILTMALTEQRLTEILDSKLEALRVDLIASFAKDLLKDVNKLNASLTTIRNTAGNALKKAKSVETRIEALEAADPPNISELKERVEALEAVEVTDVSHTKESIDAHSVDISDIKRDCAVLKAHVESCTRLINEQDEVIEDLRNRQMRNTLVFKGIPEGANEKTWDDTEDLLLRTIQTADSKISEDIIERCHRGHAKRNGSSEARDIVAQFHSWEGRGNGQAGFHKEELVRQEIQRILLSEIWSTYHCSSQHGDD